MKGVVNLVFHQSFYHIQIQRGKHYKSSDTDVLYQRSTTLRGVRASYQNLYPSIEGTELYIKQ